MNIPQIDENIKQNLHKLMDIFNLNYIDKIFTPNNNQEYHKNLAEKINQYWNNFGRFITNFNIQNGMGVELNRSSLCAINQIKQIRMTRDIGQTIFWIPVTENTWSPIEENISNDPYDGINQLRTFINQILNLPGIQIEEITQKETLYKTGAKRDARVDNIYCTGFRIIFDDVYLGYRYGPIANTNLRYEQLNSTNCAGINFSNCDLRNADFRNTNLDEANFTGANIEGACFYGTKISNPKILNLPNRSGPILNSTGTEHTSKIQYQDLINLNLNSYNLSDADLVGVRLEGSSIVNLNLNDENLKNADLRIMDCSRLDLSGLDLAKLNNMPLRSFAGANLTKANNFKLIKNLSSIDWQQVNLSEVDLSGVDFSGINLTGANLSKAIFNEQNKFSGANLQNAQLVECNLSGVDFSRANLAGANLSKAIFNEQTKFSGANLQNAQLVERNLSGVDFSRANLAGTNLNKCTLTNTKFNGCNKTNANFSYTINLTDCDLFTSKDLSNIILHGIDFSNLSLVNFNLQNTDLSECVFGNTNLDQANLDNCILKQVKNFASIISLKTCNLQRAKFIETDLSGIDFSQMNLSSVSFTLSNLEQADLRNCQLNNVVFDNISGLNSLKIDHYQKMFLINLDFNGVDTTGKSFAGTELKEVKNLKRMGLLLNIDGSAFDDKTTYEMVYEGSADLTLDKKYLAIDLVRIDLELQSKNITNTTIELTDQEIKDLANDYANQYSPYDKEQRNFNNLPTKYLNSYLASKELEALGYGIKLQENIRNRSGDLFYLDKSYHDSWSELQRQQIEQILAFWGYVKKTDQDNKYYYELLYWQKPLMNEQIKIKYVLEILSIRIIKELAVYYANQYSPNDKTQRDFSNLLTKYLNSYLAIKELEALDFGIKLRENIENRSGDFFSVDKSYHDSWSELQRQQIEQILAFWGYVKKTDHNSEYYYELLDWDRPLMNEQIKIKYVLEILSINIEKLIKNSAIMMIEDLFIQLNQAIRNRNLNNAKSLIDNLDNKISQAQLSEIDQKEYTKKLNNIRKHELKNLILLNIL